MAGLLDIFGSGGTETLGLLGMSPADIQRNRDDAQAQALYGLAARLFQGGNTGQSIAEGLQQGQKMYKSAMESQLQDKLQGFQLQDLLRKRKLEEEATNRQAVIDRAVAGAYRPAVAAVEPPTPTGPLSGAAFGEVGTPAQAAGFDFESLAPALMATAQGRKTLSELMASQKAMSGELTNLAEGAKLVRINPLTNKQEVVAQGDPKREPITADIQGYNLAKSQGFGGSFVDYQTALKKAGAGSTVVYPPGALTPDKSTVTNLQDQLLQSSGRLSSYNRIEAGFKPEYFQPSFRAGQTWSAIKEKAGANLDPQQKQVLTDFSQFKQNSIQELNAAIKAQTGATVTADEAPRIIAGLPNAGSGLFDGDSPTEFKAKLDNSTKQLRLAEARNIYALRNGLSLKNIPLDSVPKLMNDRAADLAKQYQVDLKKATPTQINAIKRQLAVEFGIAAD
jgi:hypothetical protein